MGGEIELVGDGQPRRSTHAIAAVETRREKKRTLTAVVADLRTPPVGCSLGVGGRRSLVTRIIHHRPLLHPPAHRRPAEEEKNQPPKPGRERLWTPKTVFG
nr:hypothetical protein Iba_chr01eCG2410 [Ipomoea batatas]GMC87963.1 hypothetical protein Iba_chr04eCG5530 [Ipomoea batatas]GMD86940.1 hypothetical protein Iba_scaffold1599596CG0010 [Ipomoea batatas]